MSFLVKRYKKIPVTLYRLQGRLPVMLRDKAAQLAAGRASYDLSLRDDDGLVHPVAPGTTTFTGPNGMSLRPATETMLAIAKQFHGTTATVYRLSEGLELPSGLVVWHERDDNFYQSARTVPHPNATSVHCAARRRGRPRQLKRLETEIRD
jgi:hypothetical protein